MSYCVRYFITLIFIGFALHASAAEQDKIEDSQIKDGKKLIGKMLDQYATAAGGWYLNERCHFLSDNLKKQFYSNIANCTIKLEKVILANAKMLISIQRSGEKVAADTKAYPCGAKLTNDLVVETFLMSKELSETLNYIENEWAQHTNRGGR